MIGLAGIWRLLSDGVLVHLGRRWTGIIRLREIWQGASNGLLWWKRDLLFGGNPYLKPSGTSRERGSQIAEYVGFKVVVVSARFIYSKTTFVPNLVMDEAYIIESCLEEGNKRYLV